MLLKFICLKAHNLELLFSMLMSPEPKEKPTFKVIIEELPQQPNLKVVVFLSWKYRAMSEMMSYVIPDVTEFD